MIFPECVGALLQNATASDGCAHGPRMNRLERKILEDEANLGIFGQDSAQYVIELTAAGALEIAKFHKDNLCVGRALGCGTLQIQFAHSVAQRIAVEILEISTKHVVAVLGDVDDCGVRAALGGDLHVDFVEIAGSRGLYRADLELKIRAPGGPF